MVLSTTGQGDPPDNARKFVRLLRQKTDKKWLQSVRFALLGSSACCRGLHHNLYAGLGDTNYDNFCQPSKRVDKAFDQLGSRFLCLSTHPLSIAGAVRFHPTAFADDATSLEAVVEPFSKGVLVSLAKLVASTSSSATSESRNETRAAVPTRTNERVEVKQESTVDGNTANTTADKSNAPVHTRVCSRFL